MENQRENKLQEERGSNDKKVKYMISKAEELLGKNKYTEALDYYYKVHDLIVDKGPFFKNDQYIISEKIVKVLNIIAMEFIRQGMSG